MVQAVVPTIQDILALDNTLLAVEARPDFQLRLSYADGSVYVLDFQPEIARGGVMSRLADPAVFAQVRVAQEGEAIEFPGGIDFCADALRWDAELARQGLTREDVAVRPST